MSSFFKSYRKESFFLVGNFSLLLIPLICHSFNFPEREFAYKSLSPQLGPTQVIHREIFKEKEVVDILVLGSSLMMCAIDPVLLSETISPKDTKPLNILNLSTNWRSEDINFVILNDLVKRRRVKTLIWSPISPYFTSNTGPHEFGFQFWDHGENFEITRSLPTKYQLNYYTGSILNFPRLIYLSLNRGDKRSKPFFDIPEKYNFGPKGSLHQKQNYFYEPWKNIDKKIPSFDIQSCIYSSKSHGNFQFSEKKVSDFQRIMISKLGDICAENEISTICLSLPNFKNYLRQNVLLHENWSKILNADNVMVGINPTKLYKDLTEEEIQMFYYDNAHMNLNGQRYYTKAIAPVIKFLHERNL